MMPEELEELAIMLSTEEAQALKRALKECTTNTGSGDVKVLKRIAEKLDTAQSCR